MGSEMKISPGRDRGGRFPPEKDVREKVGFDHAKSFWQSKLSKLCGHGQRVVV